MVSSLNSDKNIRTLSEVFNRKGHRVHREIKDLRALRALCGV